MSKERAQPVDRSDDSCQSWAAVDAYLCKLLAQHDEALDAALESSAAGGLPAIQVPPNFGKLLQLLAASIGAKRILEIGALGGYSTIWLARGLSTNGRLITLEINLRNASLAQRNIERAGLSSIVELRRGRAADLLPRLAEENSGPFDLTFIDADKVSCLEYYEWAVRLSRPGSLIVVDNVVRNGAVIEADSTDEDVQGVRAVLMRMGSDPRVTATAIQTVGSKGYDGWALARVL